MFFVFFLSSPTKPWNLLLWRATFETLQGANSPKTLIQKVDDSVKDGTSACG